MKKIIMLVKENSMSCSISIFPAYKKFIVNRVLDYKFLALVEKISIATKYPGSFALIFRMRDGPPSVTGPPDQTEPPMEWLVLKQTRARQGGSTKCIKM